MHEVDERLLQELIETQEKMDAEKEGDRGWLFKDDPRETCLPQNDDEPDKRLSWLEENREQYNYSQEYLPPLPLLPPDGLPSKEKLSAKYNVSRAWHSRKLAASLVYIKAKRLLDPLDEFKNFDELFKLLPKPTTMDNWRTDTAFAEQRLSGPNPFKIERIVDYSQMPLFIGNRGDVVPGYMETIEEAIANGNLYMADYSDMRFIRGVPGEKYLPTPIAIFYWSGNHSGAMMRQLMGDMHYGELLPLAIQIKPDFPIYYPHEVSEIDWLVAKLCVQMADANHHEMASHLCRTHFVIEPFAIATARQLAENHPLGVLLRPHFRFMLSTNYTGRTVLMKKGGVVATLLGASLDEAKEIIKKAYITWSVKDNAFPTEIANRNMDDTELTPHYPYRDDGMLLWNAIGGFVNDYLRLYYPTDKEIQNDSELQAWAAELADKNAGRVKDMPEKITHFDQFAYLITTIIYTAAPQHSAVNFAQYDYMAYTPNMPFAAYCTVPRPDEFHPNDLLMKLIANAKGVETQFVFSNILTNYHYDTLGHYETSDFIDKKAEGVIQTFQQNLKEVEKKINVRNHFRSIPYKYLKPSEILNSISI